MALTPSVGLALRPAHGDLEQGRKVGVYEITAQIGEGGQPSLSAACGRSYGGAAAAQARIRL